MQATTISIIIAGLLIGGVILFTAPEEKSKNQKADNVSMIDGKQIIEIDAKGGYSPSVTVAKADTPTIIKVKTQGTFNRARTHPGERLKNRASRKCRASSAAFFR